MLAVFCLLKELKHDGCSWLQQKPLDALKTTEMLLDFSTFLWHFLSNLYISRNISNLLRRVLNLSWKFFRTTLLHSSRVKKCLRLFFIYENELIKNLRDTISEGVEFRHTSSHLNPIKSTLKPNHQKVL